MREIDMNKVKEYADLLWKKRELEVELRSLERWMHDEQPQLHLSATDFLDNFHIYKKTINRIGMQELSTEMFGIRVFCYASEDVIDEWFEKGATE